MAVSTLGHGSMEDKMEKEFLPPAMGKAKEGNGKMENNLEWSENHKLANRGQMRQINDYILEIY
jgi:hypothetical protein